ncbi:MAG TPA: fused MFS/spermidine synthase [Bryobacteraceae bacterium]|nr:fused MFS/spermidine synthase [Bryobacteraceae bacterium]
MLWYAATIFLSAFLLFEVQPVIAKMILPWFGGTSAVWSTCMLFFQVVLLLGYVYAHWLHTALKPRRQALVHLTALALSLAALPILPAAHWKQAGGALPSLRILALLAATVGMPYFLLSSTSPLLQAWYARSHKQGMPYRLFALSNFASMLALLSYPVLIEPILPSRAQGYGWSIAYVAFAILCGITAWRSAAQAVDQPVAAAEQADAPSPSWALRTLWLGLAASASVLLLAVTTHLTQDVAAIPFLWILPLSLYLLSFIVCFEAPRYYSRAVFLPLLALALAFMALRLWPWLRDAEAPWLQRIYGMDMRWIIGCFSAGLFVCCMVCHGELARLKPHPRHLTGFYVIVSAGGALGGLFVGLAAPNLFRAYYEFPIGLGLCLLAVALVLARGLSGAAPARRVAGMAALAIVLCGYGWCLFAIMRDMVSEYRVVARNFYGLLRVRDDGDPRIDEDASRKLIHGVINHGQQMLREEYRRLPVTYFCPDSGIGRAMRATEGRPRRIGILGLGCGTLAAYGRAGDTIRIYEINPLVLDIARRDFTYLADTPARIETAIGDGRLTIESEPARHEFDILVMDAFSGDSVPVHLITQEAFQTYFRHLKPDGILAVNISNKYLNLEPVMASAAESLGKTAFVYHYTPPEDDILCFSCSWTLLMDRAAADAHPELRQHGKPLHAQPGFRLWTDDFSNMFAILK